MPETQETAYSLIYESDGTGAYLVVNGKIWHVLPRGAYQLVCQAQGPDGVEVWMTTDAGNLQRVELPPGRMKTIPITSLGETKLQVTSTPRPNAGGSRSTICSVWVIQLPEQTP